MTVIIWNDRFIDLHNAYDLEAFGTDLGGDEVSLRFRRNAHAIDPDNLPSKVSLTCSGGARVAFNDLCAIATSIDNEGLEIAYFDEGCDWFSCFDEDIARRQLPQGLHISFFNGFAVRIFCDEATFATQ
jgi:hypothetical protein